MSTICVTASKAGFFRINLGDIWQYRELLYFLVWRDVLVRYKQTAIGAAWAVLQPLVTMAIFTVIFGRLARIPSDNLPYSVFVYTAVIPWLYFAQAMTRSGMSLVHEANLIGKVYFPRLMMPLAAAIAPSVDFLFSLVLLFGLLLWHGIALTWHIAALPLFMVLAFLTATTMGLWLSPLNVRYRDVTHTLPFMVQIWMYLSPVVYPVSIVPEKWRFLYGLNPMAGVIEGFRWALLGKESPDLSIIAISSAVVLILLFGGLLFFKRMEPTFADVI